MAQAFQKKVNRTKRKTLLCAAVFLFAVAVFSGSTLAGLAANSVGKEWPMFRHDLAHTGTSDSPVPVTNQTAWIFNTGGPVGSPIVVDSVIYVGSCNHFFYAFGASSAEQTYSVSFTASNLPLGRSWNVTLNSETQKSTSKSIVFKVPNGVYAFNVTAPSGYEASPSSGSITVHFADLNQEVTFKSTVSDGQLLAELAIFAVITAVVVIILAVVLHKRKS